jgi:uncharacterized RDD family membrane protein YckC
MKRCPACGTENPMDAIYCASCGQSIQQPSPAIPIPAPMPASAFPTPPINPSTISQHEEVLTSLAQSNSGQIPQEDKNDQVSRPFETINQSPVNPNMSVNENIPTSQASELQMSHISQDIPMPSTSKEEKIIPTPLENTPQFSEENKGNMHASASSSNMQQVNYSMNQPEQGNTMNSLQHGTIVHATFLKRCGAYILDMIFLNIIFGLIGAIFFSSSTAKIVLELTIYVSFEVFYFTLFWVYQNGQTLGNRVVGIRVIRESGEPLTILNGIVRYFGYFISSLCFGLGFLWMLWDGKKQGWHDKLARTLVIKI